MIQTTSGARFSTAEGPASETPEPRRPEPRKMSRRERARRVPFFRFVGYYVVVAALATVLVQYVPMMREAFLGVPVLTGVTNITNITADGVPVGPITGASTGAHPLERMAFTALGLFGALVLVLPISWVYVHTRRLRYDPSLVHSLIVLPLAVAAIVTVVRDSVALAFSLAGIVAAVRFRNTLKDPKDAVYIFLALGIGIAAGVQALDVAIVMSFTFGLVVLALWRYNPASIYGGAGGTAILTIGDPRYVLAKKPEDRRRISYRLEKESQDMNGDGVLLVHAWDAEAASRGIEATLGGLAKAWRIVNRTPREGAPTTIEILVGLKKKADPMSLLGEIEDRWGGVVAAAEYIPFRRVA
jgi:hypothetical protein